MGKGHSVDYNKMSSNKAKTNRTNLNETDNNFRKTENERLQNLDPVINEALIVEDKKETVEQTKNASFNVEVSIACLNIRTGPGKNYDRTGRFTGIGTFTITEISKGEGSESGWGKLESGDGWISLDYATRV